MESETKKHLTERSTWIRLLYMILFVIIFNIAEFVISVVVVVQFLSKLFTGRAVSRLQSLGRSLANYVYEVVAFLTLYTDDIPYPFSPWPKGQPNVTAAPVGAAKSAPKSRPGEGKEMETKSGE